MFRLPLYIFGITFFGLITFVIVSLTHLSSNDIENYHTLLENCRAKPAKCADQSYLAKQQRKKVQRDILFHKDHLRLHMCLKCLDSELVLNHHDDVTEVVENLFGVHGYMQEELYYKLRNGREAHMQINGKLLIRGGDPKDINSWASADTPGVEPWQMIRYLESETAQYFYRTETLVAENVHLIRFAAPGHALKDSYHGYKPILDAIAKSVEFSLESKQPLFKATSLNATISGKARIK